MEPIDDFKERMKPLLEVARQMKDPKFKEGDYVITPEGIMIVAGTSGKIKVGKSAWMHQYVCVPLKKNGLPDQRRLRSTRNYWKNCFNENLLSITEKPRPV